MKFALIALVATASAIKIQGACPKVTMAESDGIFGEVDTNHNGSLSMSEVAAALKKFGAPAAAIPDVLNAAKKDAGADAVLDKKEFNKLVNQVNETLGC